MYNSYIQEVNFAIITQLVIRGMICPVLIIFYIILAVAKFTNYF